MIPSLLLLLLLLFFFLVFFFHIMRWIVCYITGTSIEHYRNITIYLPHWCGGGVYVYERLFVQFAHILLECSTFIDTKYRLKSSYCVVHRWIIIVLCIIHSTRIYLQTYHRRKKTHRFPYTENANSLKCFNIVYSLPQIEWKETTVEE